MCGGGRFCQHHANINVSSRNNNQNPNIQEYISNCSPAQPLSTSATQCDSETQTINLISCPNCSPLAPCRNCIVLRQTLLLRDQNWLKNQGTGFRVNQGMTTCYTTNQTFDPLQRQRYSTFTGDCYPSNQDNSCQAGPGLQRCCKHRKAFNCMMNGHQLLNMNGQQMSAALMVLMNLRAHAANFSCPNHFDLKCEPSSQRHEWSQIFPLQGSRRPAESYNNNSYNSSNSNTSYDRCVNNYETYNSHCDQSINGRLPLPYEEYDRSNNDYGRPIHNYDGPIPNYGRPIPNYDGPIPNYDRPITNHDTSNPNYDRFTSNYDSCNNYDQCSFNGFVSGNYGRTRQHTCHQQPWGYHVPECDQEHHKCDHPPHHYCGNAHYNQFDRYGNYY